MQVIGLSADEQNSIFKVLATILWLGNVNFIEGDDGNAAIADTGVIDFVGYLMTCDPSQVQKVLLTRVVETQRGGRRGENLFGLKDRADDLVGSVYEVPQNVAQATSGRDALAKALLVAQITKVHSAYNYRYNNLFEWIVSRVNVSMKPRAVSDYVIGVLDI